MQIDVMEHGRLTPTGARLFAESYDLIPYDDDVAAWRIRFGLENWAQLSPGARQAMWREVQAWSTVDRRATAMQEILMSISNPDGRFAAGLWLHVLKTKTSHNSAHRPQGRE
ncbi:hypothetical protein [Phenylobacterium sp. J367]|uniref:hypothetical protein n=1 Tax=Phenylobacterium sp. J367 TaxID=2898435 RepID=UPI0021517B7E|nr:hypothetical protein [Phenylobacterium sp. J367]MCR5879517.1 hypothetical protein [Phenylobacterium sp. J367]